MLGGWIELQLQYMESGPRNLCNKENAKNLNALKEFDGRTLRGLMKFLNVHYVLLNVIIFKSAGFQSLCKN